MEYLEDCPIKYKDLRGQFERLTRQIYFLCVRKGHAAGMQYIEKEIYREGDFDQLDCERTLQEAYMDYLMVQAPQVKQSIAEFKNEILAQDSQWVRERRMEFLEAEQRRLLIKLRRLQMLALKDLLFFPQELKQSINRLEKQTKFLSYEYASLARDKAPDDQRDEAMVQKCREVPIENLVEGSFERTGIGLKKMCCPFHNEKTPSFIIYQDNSWHCFGCGAHGLNAIDFIIKKKQTDFRGALGVLRNIS